MSRTAHDQSRLDDLLADQAMEGLDQRDELEVEAMLNAAGRPEDLSLMMTAAELEVALMQAGEFVRMPDAVAQRLRERGASWAAATAKGVATGRVRLTPSQDQSRRASGVVWRYGPWVAAAACLVVAVTAWMPAHAADPVAMAENDPNKLEATLMPWTVSDLKDLAKDTANEAAKGNAQGPGSVQAALPFKGCACWSEAHQCGYLKVAGLAPNDPCKHQYQLWIVDDRGVGQKMSGCIFNCKDKGEVTVAIRPLIAVHEAKLFAITMEQPGGTWNSDLSEKVAIARLSKH